jgi:hypothetical protein
MALPTRRSVILACGLALSGLVPGQDVGAAASPPLAQGWTMVAMQAPQALPVRGPLTFSRGNGAPTWLLPTRGGLVAIGAGEGLCCPSQLLPTEWISSDARTWRRIALPSSAFGPGRIIAVAAGRPGLVAVGSRFSTGAPQPGPFPPAIWFSPDGRTWRKATTIGNAFAHAEILAVTANGTGFVAVGDVQFPGDEFSPFSIRMAVWVSPDGSHWQLVSDSSPVFQNANASVVLHGGEGLVAMGVSREVPGSGPISTINVWTSPDGRVWHRVSQMPGDFPTDGNFQLQGAVGGNGRYVAWGSSLGEFPQYLVWTSDLPVRLREVVRHNRILCFCMRLFSVCDCSFMHPSLPLRRSGTRPIHQVQYAPLQTYAEPSTG